MKTLKLYDNDSYLSTFTASVISCTRVGGNYEIVLDRTAFFAEGGGQTSDRGRIDTSDVLDVQISDGIIRHICDAPLEQGSIIQGTVDFGERFSKMQNHTGEHIVSGIVNKKYGYNNVGFHLGPDYVTVDFDGLLTREQLDEIEDEANSVIYKNLPVRAFYPGKDELSGLDYRIKAEITGDVRIVEIEGVDRCACCAPHVSHTGEIGIIKFLEAERLRGGIRVFMLCGEWALKDYRRRYQNSAEISSLLCAPQNNISDAVKGVLSSNETMRSQISNLKRQLVSVKSGLIPKGEEPLYVFEDGYDFIDMRNFANAAVLLRPLVIVFSRDENGGYRYICAGKSGMKGLSAAINSHLDGKGGGSEKMAQGNIAAKKEEIIKFLEMLDIDKF